ncbi:COP9 signalosome complex subunit 6 [Oopsacas minuta]|uniref:COP9 signalosome complex subunit 6 n=1 Tax=Oopsacas minuta TaxID=111878 RepID=A0AAV7K0C8_9METZ|nr:COP9 signalosome complex subunit 6 [Oopsacas minuta]
MAEVQMDTTPPTPTPDWGTKTETTGLSISLHPLVVMSISDHYTRVLAQGGGKEVKVYGALLGTQKGRHLEVSNCFEIKTVFVNTIESLDHDYLTEKDTMFKQVYPNLDVIGWYSNGHMAETDASESDFHRQLTEWNVTLLFLKLVTSNVSNQLPITIYEATIDPNVNTGVIFSEVSYALATEEAERIGVDHVARVSASGSADTSAASDHLMVQYRALKMLFHRIKIISQYLRAVKSGELPPSPEVLRDIQSLTRQLPVTQTPEMNEECNDN